MGEYDIARAKAHEQDESLVPLIDEYEVLHEHFVQLTGDPDANESFAFYLLLIENEAQRLLAARIARRMRYLSRIVFSQLS